MDFKKKEIGHLPAKYLLLLFCLLPVTSSRNIDCNGKAFHCLNATHFSICVDFGFGMSITIDDFAFNCPQGTECHIENQHECEIMKTTTPKEIYELTTESLPIMEEVTTNSLLTTESNIFTTNNNIVVSNKKSLLDKNVVPASTTETTIQSAGTQGYFTNDLVTTEEVTMNTVAVVTIAHTTEPITKKRTFAERDLTNVSHNESIDVNETLNVIQETYNKMNTSSNINSETLGAYTTMKTSEATQGIEPQTEAKQNNYNYISTHTTAETQYVSLKEETRLKTTVEGTEKKENIAYTAGVTTDIVIELPPVNVEEGLILPSEVISADVSTKNSKMDDVTEAINVSDNNLVNKKNESILPNLEAVRDIASNILPGTVMNGSIITDNPNLSQGVDDVTQENTTSNIRPPSLNLEQEIHTTTKNIKGQEVNIDPSIQSTNVIQVTRTNITADKRIPIEEATAVAISEEITLSPIIEVKHLVTANEIPSLGVNDLNVSPSVTISSGRNTENTNILIIKATEIPSLDVNDLNVLPSVTITSDNLINKATEIPSLGVNDLNVSPSVTITSGRNTENTDNVINKATEIPSLDVNDLNVSPSVTITSGRNTENTDNVINKATEIPSLDVNDLNVSPNVTITSDRNTVNTDNLINKATEIPFLNLNDLNVSPSVTISSDRNTENINNLINKATEIPSLDVNDLNISPSVTVSSDRNTENTDNLINKATEISSLDVNDLNHSLNLTVSSDRNTENTDNLINKATEISSLDVNDLNHSLNLTVSSDRNTVNTDNLINKATEIPSLDVNNINDSSGVTISSDRNTNNTDNSIDKEVSNLLHEDKFQYVTSTEKSYPNLKMESISSTMSSSYYAVNLRSNKQNVLSIVEATTNVITKDHQEEKKDNDFTTPISKFNINQKPYPRNETSTENLHLKSESSTPTILPNLNTVTKTQYLSNKEENYIPETTSTDPKKFQEDKQGKMSPIEITPTLNVTETKMLSSKDQHILSEPIKDLERVTERQLIKIIKQNISSKLYTTSVYKTVDERPNVQDTDIAPTMFNTEQYTTMAQTNLDLNNNVDTKEINKITKTTNAYSRTTDSKYLSSANSVTEAPSNIETPTLVTKLIASTTKDIQITTTESHKLIVNNNNYLNVSTALPTNSEKQESSTYQQSHILLTYNATNENYNITEHLKHTPEVTTSTNLQSTKSPDNHRDISSSSINFSRSTVKPTSIIEVSNIQLQESSKANFVTEKSYIDEGNYWKVFTSTPNYTTKIRNINNTEINSFYKENIGFNINSTISTPTQGYVNNISESLTQHPNNHSHIVNSSTEKATKFENHNIIENGIVQNTIVDKQVDTVTRTNTDSKPVTFTVATKYTASPADMGSSHVTKGNPTIDLKNQSVNTINSEKRKIEVPIRSDATTLPTTIPINVNYSNSKVIYKKYNMIVTNSQQAIVTPSISDGHKQSQLSTRTLPHKEIKGETGHDSGKQNQHNSLTNQAAVGSFNCSKHKRGKFGDSTDCRKFYICIGLPIPMVHYCPNNTVFSERNRHCTKNISHCVRNNEFRCTQEGRFRDYMRHNVYYLCVNKQHNHFNRFKLQCREGFYLDKDDVKCIQEKKSISLNSQSSNVEDKSKVESSLDSKVKSKSSDSKEKKDFQCEEEGKFPHPTSCKKYYTCEKKKSVLRRKKKRCDSHEIFNKETSKCVSSDSYECED